ncbi:helix-turn-helix domain-containing protein [Entomomonas asaccharolytica]|uniref:Helix-turn-helix transcriptional regulator n=1 Tax=Entomomonas asaccharolytica TaxID=2785331 RepID=A0A974NEL1_9GAMM|nr:helix-turn-helix transcriptional regulator [Entomomonas asaccharolytica]QQP85047.1 helix-turn-helix transcriptional regulator [Entomomonas asaccharolytica]
MITIFGKLLRRVRLDRDLLLKDMADGIGISSAHLSGIETGRKPIPQGLVEKINEFLGYDPNSKNYFDLKEAEALTRQEVVIDLNNIDNQRVDAAMVFARKFKEVDKDVLKKIIQSLEGNNK